MSTQLLSPQNTVAETLRLTSAIPDIFIARDTACVGCYLMEFCTLEDVAKTYGFPLEDFLGEVQLAARTNHFTFKEAQNEK